MKRLADVIFVASAATLLAGAGCIDSPGTPSVKSRYPLLKIPAIRQDVADRNTADLAQMVKDLNSDDSAIRFYSIEGLRRLTGQTFGYHFYDDADAREIRIRRWKTWLAEYQASHPAAAGSDASNASNASK